MALGLAAVVAVVVFSAMVAGLAYQIAEMDQGEEVEINSVLHLKLGKGVPERLSDDPFDHIELDTLEVNEPNEFAITTRTTLPITENWDIVKSLG